MQIRVENNNSAEKARRTMRYYQDHLQVEANTKGNNADDLSRAEKLFQFNFIYEY